MKRVLTVVAAAAALLFASCGSSPAPAAKAEPAKAEPAAAPVAAKPAEEELQIPAEGGVDWVAADYYTSGDERAGAGAKLGIGTVTSDSTQNGIKWKMSDGTLKGLDGAALKFQKALQFSWDSRTDGDCLALTAPKGIKYVVIYAKDGSSSKDTQCSVSVGGNVQTKPLTLFKSKARLDFEIPETAEGTEIRIAVNGKSDDVTGGLNVYQISLR